MEQSLISQIISEGLSRKGLTKKQLADKCGFTSQTIINLENRQSASLETLGKIAKILEIPIDTLLIASKKIVGPRDLGQPHLEILTLFDSLPEVFQATAKKQLIALCSLATEVGGPSPKKKKLFEIGKKLPSGLVSIPIIGTANENEKPSDGDDEKENPDLADNGSSGQSWL